MFRALIVCALLILLGYLGLFATLQSPVLWYALRPDPVRSLIPEVFGPINAAFPDRWVTLERTDALALLVVPLYLAVLALVTGPLIYLAGRLLRNSAFEPQGRRQVRAFLVTVFAVTAAILLVLLFVRGLLSTDIYNYAWYSRILAVHGQSPMTHVPAEFPPDPEGAFYWIGWPTEASVYGPVWLVVSTAFFSVGHAIDGTFSAQLLSLRLLAGLAHLINAWLVWSIAGLVFSGGPRARSPGRLLGRAVRLQGRRSRPAVPAVHSLARQGNSRGSRAGALLFYIWNPLLLIEFGISGHNDVLMITFVLLAIWLHLKGSWPLAAVALTLAVLVKLPAILFLPGYLWYLFWKGYNTGNGQAFLRRVGAALLRPLQALALIVITAVVLYLPFWEGRATLLPPLTGPANRLYLHTLAYDVWWNGPQLAASALQINDARAAFMESVRDILDAGLRPFFTALLGLAAIALTWNARTFLRLLVSWGWIALVAAIAQGWYWPWYASWSIALAAVAPSRRLRTATLIFTISSLLLYVEEQVLAQHFPLFKDWSGVFVMLPPLLYILVSWLVTRRRSGASQRVPTSRRRHPSVQRLPTT